MPPCDYLLFMQFLSINFTRKGPITCPGNHIIHWVFQCLQRVSHQWIIWKNDSFSGACVILRSLAVCLFCFSFFWKWVHIRLVANKGRFRYYFKRGQPCLQRSHCDIHSQWRGKFGLRAASHHGNSVRYFPAVKAKLWTRRNQIIFVIHPFFLVAHDQRAV